MDHFTETKFLYMSENNTIIFPLRTYQIWRKSVGCFKRLKVASLVIS
jgi:hypothetical protein